MRLLFLVLVLWLACDVLAVLFLMACARVSRER